MYFATLSCPFPRINPYIKCRQKYETAQQKIEIKREGNLSNLGFIRLYNKRDGRIVARENSIEEEKLLVITIALSYSTR